MVLKRISHSIINVPQPKGKKEGGGPSRQASRKGKGVGGRDYGKRDFFWTPSGAKKRKLQ